MMQIVRAAEGSRVIDCDGAEEWHARRIPSEAAGVVLVRPIRCVVTHAPSNGCFKLCTPTTAAHRQSGVRVDRWTASTSSEPHPHVQRATRPKLARASPDPHAHRLVTLEWSCNLVPSLGEMANAQQRLPCRVQTTAATCSRFQGFRAADWRPPCTIRSRACPEDTASTLSSSRYVASLPSPLRPCPSLVLSNSFLRRGYHQSTRRNRVKDCGRTHLCSCNL